MRRALILAALLLGSCELCPAQTCPPCPGPEVSNPCMDDACSDDPWGVLNNQCRCWSTVPGATFYRLCNEAETVCQDFLDPPAFLGDSPVLAGIDVVATKVKACDDHCSHPGCGCFHDDGSPWCDQPIACGGFGTDRVSYKPYACVRSLPSYQNPRNPNDMITPACEFPCEPGFPYRLTGHVPPCS